MMAVAMVPVAMVAAAMVAVASLVMREGMAQGAQRLEQRLAQVEGSTNTRITDSLADLERSMNARLAEQSLRMEQMAQEARTAVGRAEMAAEQLRQGLAQLREQFQVLQAAQEQTNRAVATAASQAASSAATIGPLEASLAQIGATMEQRLALKLEAGQLPGVLQQRSLAVPLDVVTMQLKKAGGSIALPDAVPDTATMVLVNVVLRSGNEGPNGWYHLDMWTVHDEGRSNKQRLRGWHFPGQIAISFNSDNLEFAINGDFGRTLFYEVQDPNKSDYWHGAEAQLLAYRQ